MVRMRTNLLHGAYSESWWDDMRALLYYEENVKEYPAHYKNERIADKIIAKFQTASPAAQELIAEMLGR